MSRSDNTESFYFPFCIDVPKKVLTHKEKKELKKKQKMEAEIDRITKKGGEGHSALGDNFTVAQALKTGGALVQLETAVDIKIDKCNSNALLHELLLHHLIYYKQDIKCETVTLNVTLVCYYDILQISRIIS